MSGKLAYLKYKTVILNWMTKKCNQPQVSELWLKWLQITSSVGKESFPLSTSEQCCCCLPRGLFWQAERPVRLPRKRIYREDRKQTFLVQKSRGMWGFVWLLNHYHIEMWPFFQLIPFAIANSCTNTVLYEKRQCRKRTLCCNESYNANVHI